MAIDFSAVESAINQTKVEVQEHEIAEGEWNTAKEVLTAKQAEVATAQAEVASKAEVANKEKADVIAGVNSAITALQEILNTLA